MNHFGGHITCGHLRGVLTRHFADSRIAECIDLLSPYQFDTFAFRGNSGALMAPILAHKMGKELIMVRKPDIECVSTLPVEGFSRAQRYVLVDDLISTGRTAAKTIIGVKQFAPEAKIIAMLLYATSAMIHLPTSYDFQIVEDTVHLEAPNFNFDDVLGDPHAY